MARCVFLFVIKCICFFTCFYYVKCRINKIPSVINSLTVLDKSIQNLNFDVGVNYLVRVEGENLTPRTLIRLTAEAGAYSKQCNFLSDNVNDDMGVVLHPNIVNDTLGFFTVIVVNSDFREPLFLCVGSSTLKSSIDSHRGHLLKWIHQGQNVFLQNENHRNNASKRSHYIDSRLVIDFWQLPENCL